MQTWPNGYSERRNTTTASTRRSSATAGMVEALENDDLVHEARDRQPPERVGTRARGGLTSARADGTRMVQWSDGWTRARSPVSHSRATRPAGASSTTAVALSSASSADSRTTGRSPGREPYGSPRCRLGLPPPQESAVMTYFRLSSRATSRAICSSRLLDSASCAWSSSRRRMFPSFVAGCALSLAIVTRFLQASLTVLSPGVSPNTPRPTHRNAATSAQ